MQRAFTATALVTCALALACGGGPDSPARDPSLDSIEDGANASTPSEFEPTSNPWEAPEAGTFVHLFEWPWPDVATECESYLGPAGFAAVQVSPPNEHAVIVGRPWWERYQPVSYSLESRGGTEAEFSDMVQRCAAAGVAIYVDAVINHMSAQDEGTGSAGTRYSKYDFPGTWDPQDFHSPACNIAPDDYVTDGNAVQQCELLGLADLDTSSESVQQGLADYLVNLTDLGVAGFRIDAAKHAAPDDLAGIFAKVSAETRFDPFVFLEVIEGAGEAITSADYLHLSMGDAPVTITEFRVLRLGESFRAGHSLASLVDFLQLAWDLMPPERAVVFTDNHDTQRNGSINYRNGDDHWLANIFLLASPYGYPKLMSSYAFAPGSGVSDGPPMDDNGFPLGPHHPAGKPCVVSGARPRGANVTRDLEDGRWVCEHRDPAMAAMVTFRRVTAHAPVVHLWTQGENQFAFGREGKGFVAFNHGDEPFTATLPTGLPPGTYCDVLLTGDPKNCPPAQMTTVSDTGEASVHVPPHSAAAFHL